LAFEKPQKIKRIKIEVIRGWVLEKEHPSPRPSSRSLDRKIERIGPKYRFNIVLGGREEPKILPSGYF